MKGVARMRNTCLGEAEKLRLSVSEMERTLQAQRRRLSELEGCQPGPAVPSQAACVRMEDMFDSHCHLPLTPTEGVCEVSGRRLVCGIHEQNWTAVTRLSEKPEYRTSLVLGYGLHPWWAAERTEGWLVGLRGHVTQARQRGARVLVGEIGLDKVKGPPMEVQEELFRQQLQLAKELDCAVSVHCVRAQGALEKILCDKKAALPRTVVLHSWLGSADSTKLLLKRAVPTLYFGFSPLNTAQAKFAQVLPVIPKDRLLVESDSHDPSTSWADVGAVVSAIAALQSCEPAEVARTTSHNAVAAYSL
eukprot:Rhum_TRINITY_DN11936_c0_g1::Rhum_TRINITY_DN11936_c0_g1_i1::g.47747::m.47747/K03424/tatD; TatD DNase family protein